MRAAGPPDLQGARLRQPSCKPAPSTDRPPAPVPTQVVVARTSDAEAPAGGLNGSRSSLLLGFQALGETGEQ